MKNKEFKNKSGRNSNLVSLYKNQKPLFMRFAFRFLKKPHDVEDVVQEAFVKLMELKNNRQIAHPKSYIYQSIKNLSLNRIGKLEHRITDQIGDFESESVQIYGIPLDEQFEHQEKLEAFCKAVSRLPEKCRHVYVLRRVYGLSHQEISQQMGISVKTVEAHLAKAMIRCTDMMETFGYCKREDSTTNRSAG